MTERSAPWSRELDDQLAIERLEDQVERMGLDWGVIDEVKEELEELRIRLDDTIRLIHSAMGVKS